jgi:hypothetical protein
VLSSRSRVVSSVHNDGIASMAVSNVSTGSTVCSLEGSAYDLCGSLSFPAALGLTIIFGVLMVVHKGQAMYYGKVSNSLSSLKTTKLTNPTPSLPVLHQPSPHLHHLDLPLLPPPHPLPLISASPQPHNLHQLPPPLPPLAHQLLASPPPTPNQLLPPHTHPLLAPRPGSPAAGSNLHIPCLGTAG